MLPTKHLELSDFIKKVHQELRDECTILGPEKAWNKHCSDTEKLEKYASAMKELAINHWEKTSQDLSRIHWIYNASIEYFTKDIRNIRCKEIEVASKLNVVIDNFSENIDPVWQLLDVGSCYNPFQHFDCFKVTPIDIAPAIGSVYKCDFLTVQCLQHLTLKNNEVLTLPSNGFNIIVFSLLLEYLPSPSQRKLACEKAYRLLKIEGILIIITPDSNHVGSNVKYIKSWRFVLGNMGFTRIKYEKLKHIHCMVFRKATHKEIPNRWVNIHKKQQVFDEIYIPQDFKQKVSNLSISNINNNSNNKELKDKEIVELGQELPFLDIFE